MRIYISNSPEETKEIGFRLGKLLKAGDVVGLYGELGSGKTIFVKGIARAFGIEDKDIMSASFTMISQYNTEPIFSHIDLYRIDKDSQLDDIGLWEQIGSEGISVIEWAEKAERWLPEGIIKVHLRPLGNSIREIVIKGKKDE